MSAAYTRNMNQALTYWPPDGVDAFGGRTFGAPQEITGRWQTKRDLFRDPDGRELVSSTVVYTDQEVEVRGYLYLGTSAASDPTTVDGAREIRNVGLSPSLDATQTLHKAWL